MILHGFAWRSSKIFFLPKTLKINQKSQKYPQHLLDFKNNKHSEVVFFENEGHGFKNTNNKKQVLFKTQEFLEKTLNI